MILLLRSACRGQHVEVSRGQPVEVSKGQPVEVSRGQLGQRSAQPQVILELSQFRSARLGVTTCDLQLRKVITSSSDLRFGCSWTLWKSH